MSRLRLLVRVGAGAAGGLLVAVATLAFLLGNPAAGAASTKPVLTLNLTGVVDPFMATYIERGIAAAEAGHDPAVLITIDTPGGLDSSMRGIVHAILGSSVPVVCYTPPGARAASAGTFVMEACPINGMAPGSEIGAAHPVGISGAIETAKVVNDAAAFIAGLASRQGRNATWATGAVRNSTSLDAAGALTRNVVDFVAPSATAMLADAGRCTAGAGTPTTGADRSAAYRVPTCGAPTQAFGPTVGERLFHAVADPSIAFILLDIGLVALIVWAFHPGFHPPLAVGVVSLALGLAILQTLPVRLAGVFLLVVAAVLLVLDIKAKVHGILTTGGVVVLVLGGLLLFNPSVPSARVSPLLLYPLPVAIGVMTFFLLRALAAAKQEPLHAGVGALPGTMAVAETALTPLGRVRLRGESWAAESVGGEVAAGTPVRIVRARGLTLEVFPEPAADMGTGLGSATKGA
ncbi:MAG TPA: NfeD family protein [Actinomycetota bacterium]|nr:NfeD family protein [Actinomycetota bacterium]